MLGRRGPINILLTVWYNNPRQLRELFNERRVASIRESVASTPAASAAIGRACPARHAGDWWYISAGVHIAIPRAAGPHTGGGQPAAYSADRDTLAGPSAPHPHALIPDLRRRDPRRDHQRRLPPDPASRGAHTRACAVRRCSAHLGRQYPHLRPLVLGDRWWRTGETPPRRIRQQRSRIPPSGAWKGHQPAVVPQLYRLSVSGVQHQHRVQSHRHLSAL